MEEDEEKKAALKAWKEEKDYEVFDELPFWANGSGNRKQEENETGGLRSGE